MDELDKVKITTLSIPGRVLRASKKQAKLEDVTLSKWVTRLMRKRLDEVKTEANNGAATTA